MDGRNQTEWGQRENNKFIAMKKIYYSKDIHGNNRYSNLTQKDRIKLRECKNTGRRLTPSETKEIFGTEYPTFVKTN
jgi:hypothetical protein